MLAYNGRQVLHASLYAEHEQDEVDNMSRYQMSVDIVAPMEGMLTAIDEDEWDRHTSQMPRVVARFLRQVGERVNVQSYRKSVRGPKKRPPKRKRCKAGTHVSTAKLLKNRKQRCLKALASLGSLEPACYENTLSSIGRLGVEGPLLVHKSARGRQHSMIKIRAIPGHDERGRAS